MCNNYLPVEKGRWYRQELINNNCHSCNLNEIDDEFHKLLKCLFLQKIELLIYPNDFTEFLMFILLKM